MKQVQLKIYQALKLASNLYGLKSSGFLDECNFYFRLVFPQFPQPFDRPGSRRNSACLILSIFRIGAGITSPRHVDSPPVLHRLATSVADRRYSLPDMLILLLSCASSGR